MSKRVWTCLACLIQESGMYTIAGWPILTFFAVAVVSIPLFLDSRYRSFVSWVMVPVLFEGAVFSLIWPHVR